MRRLKVLFLFFSLHLAFPSLHTTFFLLSSAQTDGPFQDIELLKLRPAHMTVFMRYIFTQLLDPNPLVRFHFVFSQLLALSGLLRAHIHHGACLFQLFYLSVEAYLGSSLKDARALAPQICSHFLDPDAVCL